MADDVLRRVSHTATHQKNTLHIHTYICIRLSIHSFQTKVDHLLYAMYVPNDNMSNAFVARFACQTPTGFKFHEVSRASASTEEVLDGQHQLHSTATAIPVALHP